MNTTQLATWNGKPVEVVSGTLDLWSGGTVLVRALYKRHYCMWRGAVFPVLVSNVVAVGSVAKELLGR